MSPSSALNLLDPEFQSNPYPFYAELRRSAPVCQVEPGGMWAVARYEDAVTVLKNPQLFSSEGFRRTYQPAWLEYNPISHSMLMQDPPRHTRLRALVSRAFTPATLTRLESFIQATAERLAEGLARQRTADFVSGFAIPMAAAVIGHIVSIAPSLHGNFKRWIADIVTTPMVQPGDTQGMQRVRTAVGELMDCLRHVVAERRRQPDESMISELLAARVDGESLTDDELYGFLYLLMAGGLETTEHALSQSVLLLARRPELLERLRSEPALLPSFVNEMLRYEPPLQSAARLVTQEVELGGVALPAGAMVLVLLGSANRDERQFPEPERFELERPLNTMPFGHGVHTCLGASLARLEMRKALEVLLSRVRGFRLLEESVRWVPSFIIRGPAALPVEVLPA